MYKLKLGVSVRLDDECINNLRICAKEHFDYVDIDIHVKFLKEDEMIEYYKKSFAIIFKEISNLGLKCNAIHLFVIDFSEPNEEVRKANVYFARRIFEVADLYDFKYYVFHGSYEPIFDEDRQAHKDALTRSISEILPLTNKILCLEDLPRTCLCNTSLEHLEFLNKFDNLYACLDVNHFLRERAEPVVLKLRKYIKTLHISDYDLINERHWLPKKGVINWNELLNNLESIGYDGVFTYELTSATYKEIHDNYVMLFDEYNLSKGN